MERLGNLLSLSRLLVDLQNETMPLFCKVLLIKCRTIRLQCSLKPAFCHSGNQKTNAPLRSGSGQQARCLTPAWDLLLLRFMNLGQLDKASGWMLLIPTAWLGLCREGPSAVQRGSARLWWLHAFSQRNAALLEDKR